MPEKKDQSKSVTRIPTGINLRHRLQGDGSFYRFAWSPDGKMLAAPCFDSNVWLWCTETGHLLHVLKGHKGIVNCVAWSPDGRMLVSGGPDKTCKLWDIERGEVYREFVDSSMRYIYSFAWSTNGRILASASRDGMVRLWNIETGKVFRTLRGGDLSAIGSLAWSKDGERLAIGSISDSGSHGSFIQVKNVVNGRQIWSASLDTSKGLFSKPKQNAYIVAWSQDERVIASTSIDPTIRLWASESGKKLGILEGHTGQVTNISFSSDGHYFASKSFDGTVRLWRCKDWNTIAILREPSHFWSDHIAFNPKSHSLATYDSENKSIRVWDLDWAVLDAALVEASVHYTTAKIALVGDSGVGKTGLGWRLAHKEFKEHPSTHGQQFWVIDELGTTRKDGTECEAVLWDLAGQPDYRLVHSLFLDDVDIALVLFDPANRERPLSGVEFWLKQLIQGEKHQCRLILIGARVDRGTSTLLTSELEEYCKRRGISGGYVATSALRGDGLPELMQLIKSHIPWEEMPATITTATFKRIKEYVLSLKESGRQTSLLVSPEELRKLLRETDKNWEFTVNEMMTAVQHLETHGYVTILRASSGEETILLFPDVLVNLASSFVLEARRNPMGLGVLEEERLLHGGYSFPELNNLTEEESEVLLDAVTALFLKHNLCFRETFTERTFLVYPSLINEKRPRVENIETFDDVSYKVSGSVENVYAAIVVLLGYTNTFTRKHQWQNQAQYELGEVEICGFRQVAEHEGEIELVLYYGSNTPSEVRSLFQGLFERFLKRRDVSVIRFPSIICPNCGKRQERSVVMNQIQDRLEFLFCNKCGTRMSIPSADEITRLAPKAQHILDDEQIVVRRRTAFEEALVWVKSIMRERGDETIRSSCFISYAWGEPTQEKWVLKLAKDLRNAGIGIILDRWHNPPGASITEFIERIEVSDYVISVGTPAYLEKYMEKDEDRVVNAEFRLIGTILRMRKKKRERVIPILLSGNQQTSFPSLLRDSVYVDFRAEDKYFIKLFNLILRLHNIPFEHPNLDDLREAMR